VAETPSVGAFAIVPCNDLRTAPPFWERLGCEVHLTQAGSGVWCVPEYNPFGVFIRTPDVEAIAARVDDLIIRPGGVLRHREWGLYEFAVGGTDGLLVRVGWPSHLMR
jgi:hypothetical protein